MHLIPSLSLIKGKITRLAQGDFAKGIIYDDNPIDLALKFQHAGVRLLHIVDLDGTLRGEPENYHVLQAISGYTELSINYSGGINTDGDIMKAFESGATSITSGTLAVRNPDLFTAWLFSYGRDKIALSADCVDEKVAIHGWQKDTDIDVFEHIEEFYNKGLKFIKVTDIHRDGTLVGPNFDLYKKIVDRFPNMNVFASGGVRNMEDIEKLEDIGIYGVIFGKAYYENKITLKEIESFMSRMNTV